MLHEINQIVSHYRAATGAILLSTREEHRALNAIVAALPAGAEVATVAAPSGKLRDHAGRDVGNGGHQAGYAWAADKGGRVLIVYDMHSLINNAGSWRTLIDVLPSLRAPKNSDCASLVVFVAPDWDVKAENPLCGVIPHVYLPPPDRAGVVDSIRAVYNDPVADEGEMASVVDALCGLTSDAIEQTVSEVMVRTGGLNVDALRDSRKQILKDAGLEIWEKVDDMGGLGGLKAFIDQEVLPWIRDDQLAIRRILAAGVPGSGKSYFAKWLAGKMGCECCRISVPALKAGIVGASESNLRRALATIDSIAKNSALVVVIDEIDTIARDGMDGGTSSGMFAELLTWLAESDNKAVVIGTLNHLDKLDSALSSRFADQFIFDMPTASERRDVANLWLKHFRCWADDEAKRAAAAETLAMATEGFSNREIAKTLVPSIARTSNRQPTPDLVEKVCKAAVPVSKSQEAQLKQMRDAAATLRRANDAVDGSAKPSGRRLSRGSN